MLLFEILLKEQRPGSPVPFANDPQALLVAPIPAVLAPVPAVLAAIAHILARVANIFARIPNVFALIPVSALVLGIADIFARGQQTVAALLDYNSSALISLQVGQVSSTVSGPFPALVPLNLQSQIGR